MTLRSRALSADRPRSPAGLFASKVSLTELIAGVPAVCRDACPSDPASVSRRQFDRARDAAGHPHLPTAAQVLRRTAFRSWPELLSILLDPHRDLDRTLAQRAGRAHEGTFGQAQVALALNDVARVCGRRSLSAREYEAVRGRMLAAARRRRGRIATRMPTVAQVQVSGGGWDQACRLAGLRSGPAHARPGGMSVVDALDVAVTTFGVLPSQKGLERFMRANRLALARRTRPWADDLAELRHRRDSRGLATPTGDAGDGWRRDFEVMVPGLVGPAAQRKVATERECEAAVIAWLDSLAPGERPTQRSYAVAG